MQRTHTAMQPVIATRMEGPLDLRADRNERSGSPRKKSVDSAPHPYQPVKYLKLCGTDHLFLQDASGHKPAWAGYAVEEKHLFDFKAALPHLFCQLLGRVATVVPQDSVQTAVDIFSFGNQDDGSSTGREHLAHGGQPVQIVFYMFEYIETDRGVDSVSVQFELIRPGQIPGMNF